MKGQAKKDYQREYMRSYMRRKRASRPILLRPVKTLVQPKGIIAAAKYLNDADMPMEGRMLEPMPSGIDADGYPIYEE